MSIEALVEFAKGGPYYGPKGGKWADPQHKIPWGKDRPDYDISTGEGQKKMYYDVHEARNAPFRGPGKKDFKLPGETGHDPIFDEKGNPTGKVKMHPTGRIVDVKTGKEVVEEKLVEKKSDYKPQKQGQVSFDFSKKSMDGISALDDFTKGGGPYYGPRGGKWQDPQHKIPWSDRKKKTGKKKPTKAKEEKIPSLRHWVMAKDVGLPSQTINKYKGPNGYTPERKQLHSAIIRKFVDHVPTVPSDTKPVAIVMMGGGGAGKGTVVRHIMGDEHDFVNVNSDDCKEALPEFQQALDLGKKDGKTISARDAAWMAHEESSDIAEDILQIAIGDRKNLIMDGTGKDAEKYQGKIQRLKDAGYHVRVMMPHISLEEAKRRADMRAEHTGRYVPHEILEQAHHLIPGNFEVIARTADEFALFDNGGRPPRPVWAFDGQKESLLDEKFVNDFKKLGKERHIIAKEKGWMKSLLDWLDLRKADGMKASVSMDEMLKRMETKREEVLDTSSMLDDFMPEMEKHLGKTITKSMDGIDALDDFAKGGPYYGPRGGKWQDPQHKIPWDDKAGKKTGKKQKVAEGQLGLDFSAPAPKKTEPKKEKAPKASKAAPTGTKDNPLKEIPKDTKIADIRGMEFSKWEGKLALVSGPDYYSRKSPESYNFDPETMSHKYHVRHAIDLRTKKPISAHEKHLGQRPKMPGNVNYEDARFQVGAGTYGNAFTYGPSQDGTFDKGKEVWVQNKLKDLSNQEKNKVEDHLNKKGFLEASPYSSSDKISAREWSEALTRTVAEIDNTEDWRVSNAVDKMLRERGVDTSDSKATEKVWAELPGLFLTDKSGHLKTIIDKKKIKKSMGENEMNGIDALNEFAKGNGAMPSGEPKLGSGEEQGGSLEGKGKTGGSGDSASGPAIGAPTPGKDKFSEDDEDEKKAMKEHKKPLEQSTKSFRDTTPQGQRDAYALEHAQLVSRLQKGEPDEHVGVPGWTRPRPEAEPVAKSREWTQGPESRVVYSTGLDDFAAEMVKSDTFYHGGSVPSLAPNLGILHSVQCPACGDRMSKALTACPHCGEGTAERRVVYVNEGRYVDVE